MAAVSIDAHSIIFDSTCVGFPNPPVENQNGECLYIPRVILLFPTTHKSLSLNIEHKLMLISAIIVALIGVVITLMEGNLMSYIPLYLAISPLVYWLSKILFAYIISEYAYPKIITYQDSDECGREITKQFIPGPKMGFLDATLAALHNKAPKNGK
ncbi:hypothetical protein [Yersinia bercovieri]|uniref:hypothetical protein n=1 Tax=Yersinia bercovieri TaxID=634 RepID=UPI0005E814A9|nr:hypothetical protein [Yersinia bercovieri]CNI60417.1 Uncharacterised protein [Yersinia bercovieri]